MRCMSVSIDGNASLSFLERVLSIVTIFAYFVTKNNNVTKNDPWIPTTVCPTGSDEVQFLSSRFLKAFTVSA